MDIADATDAELRELKQIIDSELKRRRTLASAGSAMEEITRSVLAAQGVAEGSAWVQPTDATNAYPKDWITVHSDKTWISLVTGNVWEPGTSAWREVVEEGSGAPAWVQPTGGHDAYAKGDRVTFEGAEYVSTIDGNVWSPTAHPAGWESGS